MIRRLWTYLFRWLGISQVRGGWQGPRMWLSVECNMYKVWGLIPSTSVIKKKKDQVRVVAHTGYHPSIQEAEADNTIQRLAWATQRDPVSNKQANSKPTTSVAMPRHQCSNT